MSGAETARRRIVQRRTGGAEMALPLLAKYLDGINLLLRKLDITNLFSLIFSQLRICRHCPSPPLPPSEVVRFL